MVNSISPLTRAAGLARLEAFLPKAGLRYARNRNDDVYGHPHVSGLSPFLRYRLVSEAEVLAAVQARHGRDAEKFTAEVLWRTYWKGFLELRPDLWAGYKRDLNFAVNRLSTESGLRKKWEDACSGETGIDAFDAWTRELAETGYLHNHARMWFASIWIFTLGLPWVLGADLFLRHLADGDAASNTLSWRWVAGLHTPGKTYAATAENISRHTHGRFAPQGLAQTCLPLPGQANPAPKRLDLDSSFDLTVPSVLLVHEDDLSPDWLLQSGWHPRAVVLTHATKARSPLLVSPVLPRLVDTALADCKTRLRNQLTEPVPMIISEFAGRDILDLLAETGASQVVTPYAPCGWMADRLDLIDQELAAHGQKIVRLARPYDRALWPTATHGFFRFRETVGDMSFQFSP